MHIYKATVMVKDWSESTHPGDFKYKPTTAYYIARNVADISANELDNPQIARLELVATTDGNSPLPSLIDARPEAREARLEAFRKQLKNVEGKPCGL